MEASLRILYIANARFPTRKAHGIQIAKMLEAFTEAGISVELIAPSFSVGDAQTFYRLRTGAFRITKAWTTPRRSSRAGFLLSSLLFGITSAALAWKRAGIVYSVDLDYFSFFLITFIGKPYFFEIHSAKKDTIFHRLLFRRVAGIIAINENVRRELEKTFPLLRGKTMVFPNGVDIQVYAKIVPKELKHPAVVYTGSFQNWKGMQTVIEAARALPTIHFYFVGGKEQELGEHIPLNILVVAPQAFQDIPAWQKAADVLLLSGTNLDAYSANYTSPMKLYEYLAAGRPIVAAKTPAIAQALSEREAFFYEPDNAGSLVSAVQATLADPKEAARRVEMGKQRAREYTWEKRAETIIRFLNEKL